MKTIEVYGSDWCPDCRRAKAFLNEQGVNYKDIDISKDQEAVIKVQEINNGKRIIPTILIDGIPHTNPTNSQLRELLDLKEKSLSDKREFTCGVERPDLECGDEGEY